jgi:hypothetical protein
MELINALKALADQYGIGGAVLLIAIVYMARSIPVIYKQWLEIKTADTRTAQVKVEAAAEDQREENKHVNMLIQLVADNQRTTNTINTTTNGILESFRKDLSQNRETDKRLISGFENVAVELKATRISFEKWPEKVDGAISKLTVNFAEAIDELAQLREQIKVEHKDIAEQLGHIMAKLEGPTEPPPALPATAPAEVKPPAAEPTEPETPDTPEAPAA